ncbi:MAG: TPM domain-containing protein [Pseudomonadota bacterium]
MQLFALAHSKPVDAGRLPHLIVVLVWWALGLLAATAAHARPGDAVAIPALQAPLTDLANVLDPAQTARIHYKLADFQAQRGIHPTVLIMPSVGSEPIDRYASVVFDRWAQSTNGQDDGLLLLVAVEQQRMGIEVGRGLDARVSDALATRIADEQVKPLLSDDDYFSAIDAAIDALAAQLGGPLAERPEVAATPLVFARSSIDLPDGAKAARLTVYEIGGFAVMVVLLGFAAYRWRAMRLCSAGLAALAGTVAVTNFFGSETLIHGVTGAAALVIGALVLTITFAGMRRALERGLRDFSLRWLAVAGLTAAMAWQAKGSLIPVAITAVLAVLFAFMPTNDYRRLSGNDDRDNGDLPEGW